MSDKDKLFLSRFWTTLNKLTGVKLNMSSSFHPETDGSSERTNKTVNQCLHFHVDQNQKGWVRALPRIRFDIMNTVNASTGFTPFQLLYGRSPRIILSLSPSSLKNTATDLGRDGKNIVAKIKKLIYSIRTDAAEARDNLLAAKVKQAAAADQHQGPAPTFKEGDKVLLSTHNRRHEYKAKDARRVTKFMPRFDGPYKVI